jgi:hypothetical protein
MKPLHAVLVVCGIALGLFLASLSPTVAQQDRAPAANRYQVSAFAGQAPSGDMVHGCYTIDTATGETWMSLAGGAPQKVAEPRGK